MAYVDEMLETVRNEVERHRANGTKVRVDVEHDYTVQVLEPELAIVLDSYVNHSVLLNTAGEPLEDDPERTLTELYTLRKIEGTWKVSRFDRR